MLGFPLLYFKDMRLLMFQLSGFYYRAKPLSPGPEERASILNPGTPNLNPQPQAPGKGV